MQVIPNRKETNVPPKNRIFSPTSDHPSEPRGIGPPGEILEGGKRDSPSRTSSFSHPGMATE